MHLWTEDTKALRSLNVMFMRVLRRIAGEPRFERCAHTDVQIRSSLGFVSIDCWLSRARLRYLGRIINSKPKSLLAALWLGRDTVLPWVQLVRQDMRVLYDSVSEVQLVLPSPSISPMAWFCFVRDCPNEWAALVAKLNFVESVLDTCCPIVHAQHLNTHVCDLCPEPRPSFPSAKACNQHMRIRHAIKSPVKVYIDGSGVCPICQTNFSSRLRVLAHVSDTRRPKCRDQILAGACAPLPRAVFSKLEAKDRSSLKAARKQGNTHVIATQSAITKQGKCIGHVTQ